MSGSRRTIGDTLVLDVMHAPVLTCAPETPVAVLARTMADEHVHAVVVAGIEGTAWGVVSALDLAAAAVDGTTAASARDIAASEPVTIDAGLALSEAARIMVEHEVNHLLVADGAGRPAGVVSTSDITRSLAQAE